MHIKVVLTENIINECLALHYGRQQFGKKQKRRLLWIPLVLISISVYLIYNELQQSSTGQNFYMALLYIAFAFSYYFFMRKRMMNAGSRLLKGLGENSSFDMDISEEGLTTITSKSTFSTSWSAFTRGLITDDNVLLYQADNSFSMFSSRFFTPEDFEVFKRWVREKVHPLQEL